MTIQANITEKLVENFRETMEKYFYEIGDLDTYQEIKTESTERLIVDAFTFATNHFLKELYEFKEGVKK